MREKLRNEDMYTQCEISASLEQKARVFCMVGTVCKSKVEGMDLEVDHMGRMD